MAGWLPKPPVNRTLITLAAVFTLVTAILAIHWARWYPGPRAEDLTAFETLLRSIDLTTREIRAELKFFREKTDFGLLRYVHFLVLAYLAWALVGERGERLLPRGNGRAAMIWAQLLTWILKVGQQSLAVFVFSMWYARLQGVWLDQIGRSPLTWAIVNLTGFALIIMIAYFAGWIKSQPWRSKEAAHDPHPPSDTGRARRLHRLSVAGTAPAMPPQKLAMGPATPFSGELVIAKASSLAAKPFTARPHVPAAWAQLTYPQYRDIRFDAAQALWSGSDAPYRMDLFAPGLYFPRAVQVHSVEGDTARQIAFDLSLFDLGPNVPELPEDGHLGFSGLRFRGGFHLPGHGEEFFVMQGASYFRAIGVAQAYGLSARGLSIGTGEPDEEFPEFIEFWVERPAGEQVIVHALMDSPSVTGAYRFAVTPGEATLTEVTATLFACSEIANSGLAPLTSMFLFDGTNKHKFHDYRPAVHDSEGLLMNNGAGEWLWRPLANPAHLQVSAFSDAAPKGFGLMQRHRGFSHFADLEANYHRRPSLWVEPTGDWGPGHVMLVEIPADKEIYDNIVAFWRPETPLAPGKPLTLSYRMIWGDGPAQPLAQVAETRMGEDPFGQGQTVVLELTEVDLPDTLEDVAPIVTASTGDVRGAIVQRNPETGAPRIAFHFDPEGADVVELRAELRHGTTPVSEVWLYRWTA